MASTKNLVLPNKVIKERNDPGCGNCNNDERFFKGAYIRNFREFNKIANDPTLASYLDTNAKIAWNMARTTSDSVGFRWEGPFDSSDAGRQASAVDLFNSQIKGKFLANLALQKSVSVSGQCSADQTGDRAVDGSLTTKCCTPMGMPGPV
ncbi:MAG: hypothetical protein H7249_12600 [Chitinophagaceae bacterium]|nr:hypothetical protein [Oligoflexus sp.]